jgi:repressor LexA
MIDDQIQDGDIIIVEKRQTADNGETVVALIKGEQVTLKRFYVEPDGIRLQPANPEMAPIYLRHDEIEILGIVSGVVRMTG